MSISKFKKDDHTEGFLDLSAFSQSDWDKKKIALQSERLRKGLENFILFQRFSDFRWPSWLGHSVSPQSGLYSPPHPLYLQNHTLRDGVIFTNFISQEKLFISADGMISPTYADWSIEIWIQKNGRLFRTSDNLKNITITRDTSTAEIQTLWTASDFHIKSIIYGARSNIDEAIIDIKCLNKQSKDTTLLFTVRPYNHTRLSGIKTIKYSKETGALSINGTESIVACSKPGIVYLSNGEAGRDLSLNEKATRHDVACTNGMASVGLAYALKKGENLFHFRVALSGDTGLSAAKIDYRRVKEDFRSYASIRIQNGTSINIPDAEFKNWSHSSKISLLNFSEKEWRSSKTGEINYRRLYFIQFGLNRMGYLVESKTLIDFLIEKSSFNEKGFSFEEALSSAYLINSAADYFIHTRDTDDLQSRFSKIKQTALLLLKFTNKIKLNEQFQENSLEYYFIQQTASPDIALIIRALEQYAYMARCIGIFGDELRFKKEAERLYKILYNSIVDKDKNRNSSSLFTLYAGYPFRSELMSDDEAQSLLQTIAPWSGDIPLFVPSLGADMLASLALANLYIYLKDARGYEIVTAIMKLKKGSYSLPRYLNPVTGRGTLGAGSSDETAALLFCAIRNLIFIDYPERLEILPVPDEAWLKPGNEISIRNAPSRFGPINIRIAATSNEINFYFEELPKFVPPDIMIHLPFKVRIQEGDDFIIKKEFERSVLINGWPSIVRCTRR